MTDRLAQDKRPQSISSPEELHDYLRVTSPRLWIILGAIVILLTAFIVYASTATMENTMPIRVAVMTETIPPEARESADGVESTRSFSAALPISYQRTVKPGMLMRLGEERGYVDFTGSFEEVEGGEAELNVIFTMENEHLYLPDGFYDGELVLEATSPISFLWN